MPRDLQNVLDALVDGVIVLGERGEVERMNVEACRILETSAEATAGRPIESLVGADHRVAVLARVVLESGRGSIEDEVSLRRRGGVELAIDVAASPAFENDGSKRRQRGVVVVLRDRTIRNSLSDLVAQREELTSYGHIAAGIAHELKNPLGGIRGAAELVALRAEDDTSKRSADLIVREVDRITTLVDDLMVFARGDQLRLEPTNLHQILDGVLDLLALDPLGASTDARRRYDPSIPDLLADGDRLTQVFLNLARNALQAMQENPADEPCQLTVRTGMSLEQRLAGSDGQQLPTVEVLIEDTGPGIEPGILDRLTTPFFTTRPRGTGLGLAVAQHWVTRHGGALNVRSTPGSGTSVRVALPLRRKQ